MGQQRGAAGAPHVDQGGVVQAAQPIRIRMPTTGNLSGSDYFLPQRSGG
jgi:hypothetical protein